MKIVYVIDKFAIGGAQKNLVETVLALPDRIAPVAVALLDGGPYEKRLLAAGIRVVNLRAAAARPGLRTLTAVAKFAALLRRERPEIVHSSMFFANMVAALTVPVMTSARLAVASRQAAYVREGTHRLVRSYINARAAVILVNSRAGMEFIRAQERCDVRKIRVVENGLAPDEFARRALTPEDAARALGLKRFSFRIAALANLTRVKGHDVLLCAFAEFVKTVPTAGLCLIGDGPEKARLCRAVERLGVSENVIFAGRIEDGWRYLGAFDVSALTSYTEGFPNALVESMYAGAVPVASRTGGIPEIVKDTETGFLFPVGDTSALLAILRRLDSDRQLLRTVAANALAEARRRFDIGTQNEKLLAIYSAIS